MSELDDLYQEVILDHCKAPRNFRALEGANRKGEGYNPICGDNYVVFLKMDGDRVEDASFQGSGCCISKASASLMTGAVKGKSKAEVQALFEKVHELITTGAGDEEGVGKLAVFAGVHKFPARVKCAILSWHAVLAAVEGKDGPVTTENEKN